MDERSSEDELLAALAPVLGWLRLRKLLLLMRLRSPEPIVGVVVVVVIVPGFGSLTCEEPALVVFDEVAELPPRRLLMLLLLPKNLRRLKPFPDSVVTDSSDCLEAAGERRVGSRVCGECGGGE